MTTLHAADRFYVAATVNGKPATFVFDTGSTWSLLWDSSAARLGFTNYLGGMLMFNKTTYPCTLTIGKTNCRMSFAVLDVPAYMSSSGSLGDGLLGWDMLKSNILELDAEAGRLTTLDSLPSDIKQWGKLPIADWYILGIDLPRDNSKDARFVSIDTGSGCGVSLPPRNWQIWLTTNPRQPRTIEAALWPGFGMAVSTSIESWAKSISFGSLSLTETPIMEASPANIGVNPTNYAGTLGMAALRRLDIVIDGPHAAFYFRPKRTPAPPLDYNRIGAVFVPPDDKSDALIAHIVPDGPAWKAGIRDGDLLLKEDGQTVTNWRRDLDQILWFQWDKPAKKVVQLTLQRGSKIFTGKVRCRNILGPLPPTGTSFTNRDLGPAFRINSNGAYWYICRGSNYLQISNYDAGMRDLNEAIKLGGWDQSAYEQRAWGYFLQGDFKNAVPDLSAAIQRGSTNGWAYSCRGYCYAVLGEYKSAIEDAIRDP